MTLNDNELAYIIGGFFTVLLTLMSIALASLYERRKKEEEEGKRRKAERVSNILTGYENVEGSFVREEKITKMKGDYDIEIGVGTVIIKPKSSVTIKGEPKI